MKLLKDPKTRGEHLFEGFYPVLTPIMFEDSEPDRKRVMVVLKHLDDETELDFSAGDMTSSYWTGSVDEPDVFVVVICARSPPIHLVTTEKAITVIIEQKSNY